VDKDAAGRKTLRSALGIAAAGGALAAWSLFEAQWVELLDLDVPLPGLPPELDGVRIAHLSDFHLGTVSFNARTLERAVTWVAEREPDLAVVTGDLVTRRRGTPTLLRALGELKPPCGVFAVLGNHDVRDTRDPFGQAADLSDIGQAGTTLLGDDARTVRVRDVPVQIVGVDPSTYRRGVSRPAERIDPAAAFRILLCHFPDVVDRLPDGAFDLVLAGHYHGGQICVPTPRGKLRLEHLRAPYLEGLFVRPAAVLHVSRGLGTSFVPFRFLARPEATELTLRRAE